MTQSVDRMLAAAHRLATAGLAPGTAGNISCRVGDDIYLTASGVSFATLSRDDLCVIRDGEISGPKPTREMPFHLKVYERNPSAEAVIHLHSPAAAAVSCLEPWEPHSAIPPISPFLFMKVGNLPRVPYGHPGTHEHFDMVDAIEFPYDALMLANHGIITSGTLAQAEDAALEIEAVSRMHLQLLGHSPNLLTDQQCDELAKKSKRTWRNSDYRTFPAP